MGRRAAARAPASAWRGALFATLAPLLVLGFGASALANRLAFAGWAVAVAALVPVVLRRSFEDRRASRRRIAGAALVASGAALVPFGLLVARHREVLDLGWRAVLPALHAPVATAPAGWYGLAAVAALAGMALRLVPEPLDDERKSTRRSRRWPESA